MTQRKFARLALTTAILTVLSPVAFATDVASDPQQQTPGAAPAKNAADAAKTETQSLEGMVVTGIATSGGVKKLDASYSITAINAEQIKQANPKSTADLLKLSPGLWPESSGGQTGANIEIAGFPGGGDAPFFTAQLNGSPLFGMPSLSFFEQSSMFRLDDTIERVEIIQGGPGVVFADGQIGASTNFILRQGTSEPSGDVGVTYGSEGLWRVDGFYGFKLTEGWYGSVGGFWRKSDGVRSPGFPADDGYQLTATLTHDLDNGSLMLYARVLDDKNQFIVPIPVIQTSPGHFTRYPGFDPLTDTYFSNDIRHVHLPTYPGGGTDADLANGRGADLHFFGGNFDYELGGGFTLADKFIFTGGDMDTNALFSGPNPQTGTNFIAGNTPTGATAGTLTYANGGGAYDPTKTVIQQGWWYIHKHMKNFNNDFRVSKELFDGNTLTAGIYFADYSSHDKWSLGNQMLMTNTPNARALTYSYTKNGHAYYVTDPQGFDFNGGYNIVEDGDGKNKALYLSDSWRIDRWLFDASARLENEHVTNNLCNGYGPSDKEFDADNNPYTLYNNSFRACAPGFNTAITHYDYDKTHTSWTVGANYELADNMSVYARINKGAHFNNFDDLRGSNPTDPNPLLKIRNYEIGFKYQSELLFADLVGYHKQFSGLTYTPSKNGVPLGGVSLYGTDTKGVNFNVKVTPFENFSVQAVGDYMDGHYSHYAGNVPFTVLAADGVNTITAYYPIDGVQLQRQPKFQVALTPSYKIPMQWGDLVAFVTYKHVGDHTQDQTGLQSLGSYNTLDFGIIANYTKNWEFRLQGTNVTNELGLTESNSRVAGSATGGLTSGVLLARPIEGREVNFQVKYKF